MAREFDAVLSYERLSDRGYAAIVGSSGKIIAIITALIAVLVTFTDITFSSLASAEFTSSLAVTLIASYLMYFSLEDAGERLGESSAEYKSAEDRFNSLRARVKPTMLAALRDYSVKYSKDELEFRRRAFLCSMGYATEDYDSYIGGARFPRRAERVFKRAGRMRPAMLNPAMLLSPDRCGTSSEIESPERLKYRAALMRLLPSTACMLFTASVILTAKPDLTAAVVIEGILKLSALPVVGFRGYVAGYRYAKSSKSAWLEAKARILEGFLSEQAE